MKFKNTLTFARKMDAQDSLRAFRREFHIPFAHGKRSIYFTGNSLGAQPKSVKKILLEELEDWAKLGVEGHFHARRPWLYYHRFAKKSLAKMVGAKRGEVIAMNQLTVNLHLLLASFYRPTSERFKIIAEAGAFSSDQYALETQLRWHNIDPASALIEIQPRNGENTLRTSDIIEVIRQYSSQVALVLFGGVQYYTGQFFRIESITTAAHNVGAIAGFDLAHAVGNVPLSLHKHNVDFAVWCSYKYLNSGPGSIAGAFVHEKHGNEITLPRLGGWWGHDESERFKMKKGFKPMPGINGWQVSNVPVFQAAAHLAALEIFDRAGMSAIRKKSILLTGYLEYLLHETDPQQEYFTVITPTEVSERGCQLSLLFHRYGKRIAAGLDKQSVLIDWREPNVMRIAPAPLYNSFEDVFRFGIIFANEIRSLVLKSKRS
ncbi:MAG: kynureninase [Chryseolinea sp.]